MQEEDARAEQKEHSAESDMCKDSEETMALTGRSYKQEVVGKVMRAKLVSMTGQKFCKRSFKGDQEWE